MRRRISDSAALRLALRTPRGEARIAREKTEPAGSMRSTGVNPAGAEAFHQRSLLRRGNGDWAELAGAFTPSGSVSENSFGTRGDNGPLALVPAVKIAREGKCQRRADTIRFDETRLRARRGPIRVGRSRTTLGSERRNER